MAAMFEQRRAGWGFSWAGIILVVAFVLAVFWIFRQNPPGASVDATSEAKVLWTEGTIVSGPLEVEGRGFLTFPVSLNKRSTLDVTFATGDSAKRLVFAILPADDLERWKAGEDVKFVTNTGRVPRGVVKREIEPGYYVLVFDNRMNEETMRIVESSLIVD